MSCSLLQNTSKYTWNNFGLMKQTTKWYLYCLSVTFPLSNINLIFFYLTWYTNFYDLNFTLKHRKNQIDTVALKHFPASIRLTKLGQNNRIRRVLSPVGFQKDLKGSKQNKYILVYGFPLRRWQGVELYDQITYTVTES